VARTQRDTNMNRAGAEGRRLLLWCFRNRETGAITVAQTPNFALVVFLVSTAILLTKDCHVLFANAKAEGILQRKMGLRYERGRLAATTFGTTMRLQALAREAARPRFRRRRERGYSGA
jgi:hypothetical protein